MGKTENLPDGVSISISMIIIAKTFIIPTYPCDTAFAIIIIIIIFVCSPVYDVEY